MRPEQDSFRQCVKRGAVREMARQDEETSGVHKRLRAPRAAAVAGIFFLCCSSPVTSLSGFHFP